MQVITDPQFNYLKGLIKKVGKDYYAQMRTELEIGPKFTERQLSKAQATKLIGHLKAEADKRKAKASYSGGFEIDTYYDTTMLADSEEELMIWAKKRFPNNQHTLKKIEAFVNDARSPEVEVPQYKIKRSK